jgi:hypothetical protein
MAGERSGQRTIPGECPTHGKVEGTKDVPSFSWPAIVFLFQRGWSALQPYRCPECGRKVTKTSG